MQCLSFISRKRNKKVSIPQAVWIACNGTIGVFNEAAIVVSIPQAVWIACNLTTFFAGIKAFQYRKRYGLHAIDVLRSGKFRYRRFNTASGMDCMQSRKYVFLPNHWFGVSIPQAVWIACNKASFKNPPSRFFVSIPQAVWIACNQESLIFCSHSPSFNTASGMDCMQY